jgi:hypothetical protein
MKMGAHKNEGLSGSEPGDSQMEGGEHEGRGYNDGGHRGGVHENKEKREQLRLWLSAQLARSPETEQTKKK